MGETDGNARAAHVRGGEAENGEGRLAFGIFLRQTRLRRGFTLPETALAVRVPEQYLEALEDGEYDALPPKPYVKGFLDAYAAQLSLDPGEVWKRFEESFSHFSRGGDEGGAIFGIFRPQGEKLHWRDWAVPIALGGAALILLAGRWFLHGEDGQGMPPPPVVAEHTLGRPSILDAPGGESELGAVTTISPEDAGAGVHLLLRAESASWLAVEKDGALSEEWTMEEGETRVITARKSLVLSLGNAGAVQLNVNGRELGFIGHRGEVKRNILFTAPEE